MKSGTARVWGWLLLSLLCLGQPAHAFVDPPVLVPANPREGEPVFVQIRSGDCDFFQQPDIPGISQITRDGNSIRIRLETFRFFDVELCFIPVGVIRYPVGAFSPGSYILEVQQRYPDISGYVVQTIGVIPFQVSATTPIPSLGLHGLSALVLGLVLIAWRYRRPALAVAGLGILASSPSADATQYLEVLLSDATMAKQVVDGFHPNAASQPLQGLAAEQPTAVRYLLPQRAQGDFLAWLNANPGSVRARLERYVVVSYGDSANLAAAKAALSAEIKVQSVNEPPQFEFASVSLLDFDVAQSELGTAALEAPVQYGRAALNVDAGWQSAGGWGLVGIVDSGLATMHPDLRAFSAAGQYLGGHFLPVVSWDQSVGEANVDEAKSRPVSASICDPDHDGFEVPDYVGHGTHLAGLVAANSDDGDGISGVCKNCGIGMWKIADIGCLNDGNTLLVFNISLTAGAMTILSDNGAQAINMSFVAGNYPGNYCQTVTNNAFCDALTHANYRGAAIVAASGNDRTNLYFPANDQRVISAGGFNEGLTLWNQDTDPSPNDKDDCPFPNLNDECGSNWTTVLGGPKQELVASAHAALSTIYPGHDWNPRLQCGDSFGTPTGDGIGACTGTSMAAPQIAGVVELVRSVNPLVLPGNPAPIFGELPGIRTAMAQTTFQAQANQSWSQQLGYGRPDAAAAVRRVLGKTAGATVKNRVIPLFHLYSTGATDHAYAATPQQAISLIINQLRHYDPQGPLVPGYASFPSDPGASALPAPRAAAYILSTEYKPSARYPDVIPLFLMDRERNWPVGCVPGPGCNNANRDFLLTTRVDLEAMNADGYSFHDVHGYIFSPCTPEPTCIPPGAQKFYRKCKLLEDDCAVFLENERATFEAQGYLAAYPAGSSTVLGYAYPATDSDGDTLVDGMEYVIGTNPTLADSDGDGASDGSEFPLAGLQVSDPCSGAGAYNCPADIIFRDGFQ